MKRITTLLRESEAMAVRNAVCIAGGKSVVITPIPQHQYSNDPWQWRGKQCAAQGEVHVRLEVTADDDCYGGVVSAIKKISHSGRIILVFRHDKPSRHAACNHNQSLFCMLGEEGRAGISPYGESSQEVYAGIFPYGKGSQRGKQALCRLLRRILM